MDLGPRARGGAVRWTPHRWHRHPHESRGRILGEDFEQPLRDPRARRALDELHRLTPNFEISANDRFPADEGWLTDDYCQPLPSEAPGPPVAGGSWEVAQDLMRSYEFADPSIVRAVYHPDRPLEERDMLLELRFHGLRFHVGVRVGGVIDEVRDRERSTGTGVGMELPHAPGSPRDGPDGL